jgi:hypothetical protein
MTHEMKSISLILASRTFFAALLRAGAVDYAACRVKLAVSSKDWKTPDRLFPTIENYRRGDFQSLELPNQLKARRTNMKHTLLLIAALLLLPLAAFLGNPAAAWAWQSTTTALRIVEGEQAGIEVLIGEKVMLRSPGEGLWSVATAWKDGWPADWQHARPKKVEKTGDWTTVSGFLSLPQGRLDLADSYRPEGELVRCIRRFAWHGKEPLSTCTLSVRWVIPGAINVKPLLPGIIYYGNPMGGRRPEAVSNMTVAVHNGKPGEESFFEEHRYPVPMAVAEWQDGAAWRSAALHTIPSLVSGAHQPDQWWSLGVVSRAQETELSLLSGPCVINGRRSFVKTFAHGGMDYPDTWLAMRPGDVVEKTFFLQACPSVERGSGFRAPLHAAISLHAPFNLAGMPTFDRIVRDKYRYAVTRFRNRDKDPGFEMSPRNDPKRAFYSMGWCGGADAAGPAILQLAKRLGDPKATEMAIRSLNFLATSPVDEKGFRVNYEAENGKWSGGNPVSIGQTMENFARAVRFGRAMKIEDVKNWEAFLKKACEVQSARILAENWRPASTSEAYYVSPLCLAYGLFGDEQFKKAALKAAEHFTNRHRTMEEPYWGGSCDASCEDKEATQAALGCFVAVYEMTKDPKHLEWASHALDSMLTWTIVWDIPMPPSILGDKGVKLHGWSTVSAQHPHADFYSITLAPEVYRMGQYLQRDDLKRLAVVMFRSMGQLIDPYGSQGEQIDHTNFAMTGEKNLFRLRGTYSESYTPFWITTHFLTAAAEFERMGVDLDAGNGIEK